MSRKDAFYEHLKRVPKSARRKFIGYCWKCGFDVETDYCERCQHYVQPSPHDKSGDAAEGKDK